MSVGDRTGRPYTFEFEDGTVRAWYLTDEGAEPVLDHEYEPSIYVSGPDDALDALEELLTADPKITEIADERRYITLRDTKGGRSTAADSMECNGTDSDGECVLRVSLERVSEVQTLAREIRSVYERQSESDASASLPACAPGTLRLFDVDLEPGFRYCLDRGIEPLPEPPASGTNPARELRTLSIEIGDLALAERDVSTLTVDGDRVEGEPADVLWSLGRRLDRTDPDVLVLSHGDLVPLLSSVATAVDLDGFHLGRLPGWTQIAGTNTDERYGQVGYSPARYRVPGRAIVDVSNSFLWHQSGLDGIVYMVGRTGRPLQEAAWGSIGTLLTSRQIRIAREEWDVLAPWNKWEPEAFKDVGTLHDADRGGFTFAPEVGFHEDVHEIDFASLYPRIICRHNVSPETVGCACCVGERTELERVPELGYRICEHDGFLPRVLGPLLDDRAKIKRQLAENPPESEARRLRAESGAIKWVMVSCFGYQGYRNAKFGRIECHEAINAYARTILLDAKARLERAGWHIVHGIVDSLWVTPRPDKNDGRNTDEPEPEPLDDVLAEITADVGITLEHDGTYEWVCFVPLRGALSNASRGARSSAPAGALTKYFGKRTTGEYTFRGIELRQRSTPHFVAECQREFVETLDAERDPGAVCDRLGRRLSDLRSGAVDPVDLVLTKRVSKALDAYHRESHTVGALRRYEALGAMRYPGQSVRYVVVDDDARRTRERVRLDVEYDAERAERLQSGYDADYYIEFLVRAAESIVSPLGWDRTQIRRYLGDGRTVRLSTFSE